MKDNVLIYPFNTEKAVKLLEENKTISFSVLLNATKKEILESFKRLYGIAPVSVNVLIRGKEKIAYIKLPKDVNVVSLASEMGMQV